MVKVLSDSIGSKGARPARARVVDDDSGTFIVNIVPQVRPVPLRKVASGEAQPALLISETN
jgi:hypothetical protein